MPLTSSMEDYLEAVLVLQQQNGYVRCVDVAEHLGVTKPSVSRAVKELSKKKCLIKRTMARSPSQNRASRSLSAFMKNTSFLQSSLLRPVFPRYCSKRRLQAGTRYQRRKF